MSFLFKTPQMPSIVTPKAPSLPAPIPSETSTKEEEKKKIRKGAAGSTILTSPKGVLVRAPSERKFLLGE